MFNLKLLPPLILMMGGLGTTFMGGAEMDGQGLAVGMATTSFSFLYLYKKNKNLKANKKESTFSTAIEYFSVFLSLIMLTIYNMWTYLSL